jgi:serine protease Do
VTTYNIQISKHFIRWLCLGIFIFMLGGTVYWAVAAGPDKTIINAPALALTTKLTDKGLEEGRIRAEGLSQAFRYAAKKVLPTVVVIKTPQSDGCPRCGSRECDNTDDNEGTSSTSPENEKDAFTVIGSGFLVDPSGIVMTNKHVVKGARKMVVQMADGRKFPVKQVKTDSEIDLAILLIETKESLPAVRLGNSETTEIGDWVLAVGCPLDLEQTVSAGIISAKNRSFCPNHQAKLLQTDAAINPGSSGGPLVNLNGEVIGITTSIASDDGGYQGIGFAIPANLTNRLLQQVTKQ